MRFERREQAPTWLYVIAPVMSVVLSMLLCSLLILWAGASIPAAAGAVFKGAFSSTFALSETLARATPLLFTGLAACIAFKARFWNIGAEGQLYCGALAATWLGTGLIELPPLMMIPLLFAAGALAGGIALSLPVLLKNRLQVDEVVTTLLLNFVILLFVGYCLEGPMKDPMAMGWPQTAPIIDNGVLPVLVPRTRLHLGILVALAMVVLVALLLRHTRWGFDIRAHGMNPVAASHAGISNRATVVKVAMISGGLAGMAGVSEVAGLKGYLTLDLSPGFGYTGIAVAMLASLNPLAVVLSALFLAGIYVGADSMSRSIGVPSYIADIMVAASVLCVLIGLMLCQYRLRAN